MHENALKIQFHLRKFLERKRVAQGLHYESYIHNINSCGAVLTMKAIAVSDWILKLKHKPYRYDFQVGRLEVREQEHGIVMFANNLRALHLS